MRPLPLIALLLLIATPTARNVGFAPAPTEHVLSDDAEERNREGRKRWIEEMHRTAPDVDWRGIERQNGLDRMARRNEIVAERRLERSTAAVSWSQVGSHNLAGRMHAAALSAAGDSLYGGSSLGGVWKADLSGQGWRPVSDNLYGGAHGLAVCAGPPETITRITDDGLLHFTSDGGATWQRPAGPITNKYGGKRVARDASDPNRVYVLLKPRLGAHQLYRSDDGGATYVGTGTALDDFWIDRQVGGTLWGIRLTTVQKSTDYGASWTTVGTLPVTPFSVVMTGSEAGAPTLYAALSVSGQWQLYRSTDAGANWAHRYTIHDFWETMAASITDPDLVLFGGVELWRSTNGGSTFALVNGWGEYYGDPVNKLHADFPGLDVVWTPQGQEIFYPATDGGLYRSDDGVASVTNISLQKLGVSQYYSTHTSLAGRILAGSQDQGYQRTAGPPVDGTWRDFIQLISGDYGHLTSSDGTHTRVFSVYPGFVLVQEGEIVPVLTTESFPANETQSWMPYILADPDDANAFYFCATHLHRYQRGAPGTVITPSAQDFTVAGGAYLTAVAISPVNHDDRIAVTDTGVLWYSTAGGANWTLSPDSAPSAHYFYGTALEFSPTVAGEAYVGGSGYGFPAVYRTRDGGVTWTAVSTGLPGTLVYDLAYEQTGEGVVYAAAEAGPYRLDPLTDTWESLDDPDVPLTRFWCVEAVPAEGLMRFGTYGRGIWDWLIQKVTDAPEITRADETDAAPTTLRNHPNPFTGTTVLRYAVPRAGDVRLRVYDVGGRLVRNLDPGFRTPGRHQAEWDARNDAGVAAAPGVYVARLETAGTVEVRRITLLR